MAMNFIKECISVIFNGYIRNSEVYIHNSFRKCHENAAFKIIFLEIMMEHIIDCLLDELNLSRANLIYSGGGHCYMLLPDTDDVKRKSRILTAGLMNGF